MVAEVIQILRRKGIVDVKETYINQNRNAIVDTPFGSLFCKWQTDPFMRAGKLVPKLGNGIGLTVNTKIINEFINNLGFGDNRILHKWLGSEIYYITVRDFLVQNKPYLQSNLEDVLVVSIKDLKRWS